MGARTGACTPGARGASMPATATLQPASRAAFTRVAPAPAPEAKPVGMAGLLALSAAWLGLAAVTSGFLDSVLPTFLALRGGTGGGDAWMLGAGLSLGLAAALLPVLGRWSDRLRSVHGQRRTPMLAGGLLAVLALGLGAVVRGTPGVLAMLVLLQAGALLALAGAQPLLVDVVPARRRGLGAGLRGFFEASGALLAGAAGGVMVERAEPGLGLLLLLAALALPLALAIVAVRGRDRPASSVHAEAALPRAAPLLRAPRGFGRAVASRACAGSGLLLVQLALAGTDTSTRGLGLLLGVAALGALAGGGLADRLGRRQVAQSGALLLAAGGALLLAARDAGATLIFGGLAQLGGGMLLAATWAVLADLAPRAEAGRTLGLAASGAALATLATLLLVAWGGLPDAAVLLGGAVLAGAAAASFPKPPPERAPGRFAVVQRTPPGTGPRSAA